MALDEYAGRSIDDGAPQICFGRVGWKDADKADDPGNPTGDPDQRMTFVRVTLEGSSAVRGSMVLCRLSTLVGARRPKLGTRVLVAIPYGMFELQGAGVIIATLEDDPERLEEDRRVLDFTGEHVLIRAKSVTLESDEGEFVSVGEPRSGGASGVIVQAKDGTGAVWQTGVASMFVAQDGDAKSVLQMTPSAIECMSKSGGMWKLDGNFYTLGSSCSIVGGAVYLGTMPTVDTPVRYGPATGAPGLASTSVFVSP